MKPGVAEQPLSAPEVSALQLIGLVGHRAIKNQQLVNLLQTPILWINLNLRFLIAAETMRGNCLPAGNFSVAPKCHPFQKLCFFQQLTRTAPEWHGCCNIFRRSSQKG